MTPGTSHVRLVHDREAAPADPGQQQIDRIVVIHDFAAPEGGAGVLAHLAIRSYRKRGYPVTLLTGQGSTPALQALGVEVVGAGSEGLLDLPISQALKQGYHNGQAEQMIADWIKRNDTPSTVYHMHNWAQILSPAVFRALTPVARRTVVTCHDFFNVCPNGSFLHFGKSEPCMLKPLSLQCLVSQCDRRNGLHKLWRVARHRHLLDIARFGESGFTFTFIHDRMRQKFLEAGFRASNLLTIPNPVEQWTQERIAAECNSGFLFVGRIGRDKGADVAVAAARKAGEVITLVGTGELEEELRSHVETVTLAGWCDKEAIAAHARNARALIVPSRVIEPFGLVILEAAKSGLPVIVSDRAFLADDVDATGMGCRFLVNDVDGLAAILKDLSRDDAKVRDMSLACREHATDFCHTPDSWSQAFIDALQSRLG